MYLEGPGLQLTQVFLLCVYLYEKDRSSEDYSNRYKQTHILFQPEQKDMIIIIDSAECKSEICH
jgi:hypothetical protein